MNTNARRFAVPLLVLLALVLGTARPAAAKPPLSADVSAELSVTALHPGDAATVGVIVTVHPGLHAQSHEPGDPNYYALVVAVDKASPVVAGDVKYPPGEDVDYPLLGHLNVYVDRVVVYVPVTLPAGTATGPVEIRGTASYQACNDRSCFAPETQSFVVKTTAVAAGAAAQANDPDLFKDAPPVKAAAAPTTKAVTPTPPPAAAAMPASPTPTTGATVLGLDLNRGGLPLALIAAFVVGIVFNAMPCVLPVVPLKIMGFYEVSRHDRRKSLFLGAVFSAGIIFSFAVLALLIVVLHVINWGGLFQQTWFTVAIVGVLLAMALGTFGFFDVALPANVYAFSPRHDTVSGNFLFGILTAALSTPCTFGVFATLLVWAITQPAWVGSTILITVGVGMAFPYLALSAFPEVARNFPRTGPWAGLVKQLMGFLLLGTAVYFAQPLMQRFLSVEAFWWSLFAVVAVAALFLVVRAIQVSKTSWPIGVAVALAVAMVVPSLYAARRLTERPYQWQPYSPAALAAAQAAGRPAVIDFTATWCGNCHWLEAFVLHDPRVVRAVRDRDAVMLQADVTAGDAAGQPLLDQLSQTHAIPLTAVYAPAGGKPILLDGIYNADDFVRTLSETTKQAG